LESVLIQSNFPHRISLSQASQITGYHQDYLGLLCRLGKIEASKIGRNWYTTQSELNKFLNPELSVEQMGFKPESEGLVSESAATTLDEILSERIPEEAESVSVPVSVDSVVSAGSQNKRTMAPTIVENVVITEMKSIPIRLVKKPAMPQHHTLQSLITRTKLDQLKQEVLQIAGFMDSVSNELAEHRSILKKHEAMLSARKDLASAYASNIDFGINPKPQSQTQISMIEDTEEVNLQPNKSIWLWPSFAISLVVIISLIVLSQAIPQTTNYATTIYYKLTQPDLRPQVAGEVTTEDVSSEIQK
jgi:hypothetical protein